MEEKKIRPQDKWNAKAGLISKSYKLKHEVVKQFAEACDKAGVSQAAQLTKMMRSFACKKDVEKEYVKYKQPLDNSVIQLQNAIRAIRKIQNDIAEESAKDELGFIVDSLLDVKDNGLKAMIKLYDIYNEVYQNTQE